MKSLKKKISSSKPQSQETPLISKSPENPTYSSARTSSTGSTGSDHLQSSHDKNSVFDSTSSVFRPSSPTSPGLEVQFHKPGKQEQSWVKDAREQSSREPIIDPADVTFGLVTVTLDDSWISGMWQSIVLMIIFVLLPSVLFAIAGLLFLRCAIIPNLGRSLTEKRKLRHFLIALVAGIILSLVKDSIIAMTVVYSRFEVSVTIYEIIYAIVLLFSLVIFVFVPVLIFVFSGVQFSYGTEGNDTKKRIPNKSKKLAENFMKENFDSIHMVKSLKSMFGYVSASIPRWEMLFLVIAVVILSVLRNFTPFLLMTSHANSTKNNTYSPIGNITLNVTKNATVKATSSDDMNVIINNAAIVLSALNAFIMSITLSCVFLFAFSWQLIMAGIWKKFASLLIDSCELVSLGSEGIVAWWRVYQTARFLTWSAGTSAGCARYFINAYFMAAISILSIFLLSRGSIAGEDKTNVPLVIIDNLLMIAGLGMMSIVAMVTTSRQNSLFRQLGLIRLNMTQELRKYSAGAQGEQEGEFHAHLKKFKGRNLRASLQVLQEMIPVAKDLETSSMSMINIIFTLLVVSIGIISSALSIKKLLNI